MSGFEASYFEDCYRGDYERAAPPRKFRQVLREILSHRHSGRLLEVGCAYGGFLREAAALGSFDLSGTDVSGHALEQAASRLEGTGVELRPGGLFESEWEAGSFDLLCMFDVIEHIEDQDAAFARIDELLAPDGLLVLSVPVYDGPLGPVVQLLDKDPTHLHKLGRQDWLRACGDRGYELKDWIGLFRYFLAGRVYLHWPSRSLRGIAPAILLVLQRGA